MPLLNPSLNWELLDNTFYRSTSCYDDIVWPDPDFDLANYNVSIGPYASTIATYPKHVFGISHTEKIRVFTATGKILFSIPWNFTLNPIVDLGWTRNGKLLIVLVSGKYRIYHNYNGDFDEFDILQLFDNVGDDQTTVSNVLFADIGFTIQTSSNIFIYIQSPQLPMKNSSILFTQLQTTSPIEPYHIHAWNAITPVDETANSLNSVQIHIFTSAGLCILEKNSSLPSPSFLHSSILNSVHTTTISSNQSFIALYSTAPSKLYIFDTSYNSILLEKNIDTPPISLSWCSSDVVALSYATHILIIGPSANTIFINLQDLPHLHCEDDGIYFLTTHSLLFFSKVSSITESIFRIGSTTPSAILLDSIEYLDKHSPKANEMIEIISDDLVMAVDGCIRASAEEFDPYWQKNLLRAANLGKVQLDLYDPSEFLNIVNTLRVLNILRNSDIGIPLTFNQFQNLGASKLIDLLLLRNLHYLSLKICQFLNIPKYNVLTHWACSKIENSSRNVSKDLNDYDLLSEILARFKDVGMTGINWIKLATIAYIEGRINLSRELLSYEPNTKLKIRFLLDNCMNNTSSSSSSLSDEMEFALAKADEDDDVDSLVLVQLHLLGTLSNVEFFKAIDGKKSAEGVFKSLISQCKDGDFIRNFMYQDDDLLGLISLDVGNLANSNDHTIAISKLQATINRSKHTSYISSALSRYAKLSKIQSDESLTASYPEITPGDPPLTTMAKLIPHDLKLAQSHARKLGISQRSFTFTVLKTLSKNTSKHAELYEFAINGGGGKNINFEPFYYELLKNGMKRQAGMYLPHCKKMNSLEKIKGFILCGMWKDAVSQASEAKNVELLRNMRDSKTGWESKLASDEIERITGTRD